MFKKKILSTPFWRESVIILGFNAFLVLVFFLFQNTLPPVIPLFYGMPKGTEQLAPRIGIILPPTVSMAITATNFIFLSATKNDFLLKLLIAISFIITLLSTVTVVRIFMLVSSL